MSLLPEYSTQEKSLDFFGTITASLSHEINNVFAIVNELTGLLSDLLLAHEQGRPLDPSKLKNTVERMAIQLKRGKEIVTRLNHFAHSVDEIKTSLDAKVHLERVSVLCQRFFNLRKVQLDVRLPKHPLQLMGSPYDFQHVIYRCIEIALSLSKQGDSVALTLDPLNDGALVKVTGGIVGTLAQGISSKVSLVSDLASQMGGKLDTTFDTGKPFQLTLQLPRSLCSLLSQGK